MMLGALQRILLIPILLITFSLLHAEPADPSVSSVRSLVERYRADYGTLNRLYSIQLSPERHAKLRRLQEDTRARLDTLDFSALDSAGRIDWILLRNHLDFELKMLGHEVRKLNQITPLIGFASKWVALEEDRRLLKPQDPRASAELLDAGVRELRQLRDALEQQVRDGTAPGPVHARRAAMVLEDLRRALRSWNRFYADYDPVFTWWIQEPFAAADKALEEHAGFLRERLAGYKRGEEDPIIGDPLGREALIDFLEAEWIPYSPEELIRIGEREFEWCEREMKRAADDLGFNGDWKKALQHVSQLHVGPGEQPALIRQLAEEAVEFLESRDLVTIPELAKRTWRMEMMPPERQKVNPYFTGGEVISVSYPTSGMSHEDKLMGMRGNNIHFSRATVHHELIPGHHLQGFMAQRWNTHRQLFRTPFLIEGWALYWEMLLWDLDFAQSAEDRVGMLFWRSHRCARILFSLKFHMGDMTAQECIDYLVERVGHEPRNAMAEVRRSVTGDYSPTYQAAYMLGGLQIRAMRRELVDSGRYSDRAFHDAILRENSIPIELIRAHLMDQSLAPNSRTSWRFYGDF